MEEKTRSGEPLEIEDRTYRFALRVVRLCIRLDQTPGVKRTLGNQLLRSGTSIGANVEEAHAAQSRADFVNKMAVALKESRETRYWLRILIDSKFMNQEMLDPLLAEATEIMKVLGAITSKSRRSLP